MRKRAKRIIVVVLLSAVVVAAGGYGVWRLVGWTHERGIDRRIGRHRGIIARHARANRLPAELVEAVVRAESGGNPEAISDKGARGLMQVTDITKREVLRRRDVPDGDLLDAEYNVRVGTAYLRMMVDRFDGDLYLALAAYHLGPTRMREIQAAHPGPSGREIVERHAPAVTARYCRAVLRGLPERLAPSGE